MPRYFFHVHDGEDLIDEIGTELADIQAARVHAVQYTATLLIGQGMDFWNGADWRLDVMDDGGAVLFTLEFTASGLPT